MKNKIFAVLGMILLPFSVKATEIDTNSAKMQAMDKITGRVSLINIPVNGAVEFGSLSIVVRSCKTRPTEETPDNFAFVDITDKNLKGEEYNIFKGWMISSSPATHAVEHPIYDVWLLQCIDSEVDKKLLMTAEQLDKRDALPRENVQVEVKAQSEKINNQINEMTAEHEPENLLPEAMSEEFSYDDDMEISSELSDEEVTPEDSYEDDELIIIEE